MNIDLQNKGQGTNVQSWENMPVTEQQYGTAVNEMNRQWQAQLNTDRLAVTDNGAYGQLVNNPYHQQQVNTQQYQEYAQQQAQYDQQAQQAVHGTQSHSTQSNYTQE